jgi:hypothetical protein
MKTNREENIRKSITLNEEKIQKLQAINLLLEEQLNRKLKEPKVLTDTEKKLQSKTDRAAFEAKLNEKKLSLF